MSIDSHEERVQLYPHVKISVRVKISVDSDCRYRCYKRAQQILVTAETSESPSDFGIAQKCIHLSNQRKKTTGTLLLLLKTMSHKFGAGNEAKPMLEY